MIKPAESEQGVFWYFDWHLRNLEPSPGAAALKLPEVDGWCWRATKADFKFEYSLVWGGAPPCHTLCAVLRPLCRLSMLLPVMPVSECQCSLSASESAPSSL